MQKVYLKGNLSKFGEVWETSCSTLPEIFKLISCQTPGFKGYVKNLVDNNIDLCIVKGKEIIDSVEDLLLLPLKDEDIIISEVPRGAEDAFEMIAAAIVLALIAVHAPFSGTELFTLGETTVTIGKLAATISINLAIAGVSMMLAPGPEVDAPEGLEEEEREKLFNGPSNVTKQNIPIPLLYGELVVGGATIYSSVNTNNKGTKKIYQDKIRENLVFGAL